MAVSSGDHDGIERGVRRGATGTDHQRGGADVADLGEHREDTELGGRGDARDHGIADIGRHADGLRRGFTQTG